MNTPTTGQLFRDLAGITRPLERRQGLCEPTHEIYLPRDNQGVRRMAFGFGYGARPFAVIEFVDYAGTGFWGGLPIVGRENR